MVNARILRRLLPNAPCCFHNGGHIDLVTGADTFGPIIDTFLNDPHPDKDL